VACVSVTSGDNWPNYVISFNRFRIFTNASANVAGGMAAALVALVVLPPFLTAVCLQLHMEPGC